MRLFEAIVEANHRAVAGDASAGLHPADYADDLPVIALTCIDPRLNPLFPNVLGITADQFIWLRNAGNIITGSMSSTMRSLALACAVKEGREIAIIGHTDCQVCRTTTMQLLDKLQKLGVPRSELPENINEFFGMFATERQNVIKGCGFVRQSPIIGPNIPVHGLLVDIQSGKLDWVVNGYETWMAPKPDVLDLKKTADTAIGALGSIGSFDLGEMKFPDLKIGDAAGQRDLGEIKPMVASVPPPVPRPVPPPTISAGNPKIPVPPPASWIKPGKAETPGALSKKPLPPPIRPRIVKPDQW
jgi:carbonic anhydrase